MTNSRSLILVGILIVIGILAYVVFFDKPKSDELAVDVGPVEDPVVYENGAKPSGLLVGEDEPMPPVSPFPSPTPMATHKPINTAAGDVNLTLLVAGLAGASLVTIKYAGKLAK